MRISLRAGDLRMIFHTGGAGDSLHIGKPHVCKGAAKIRSRSDPRHSHPALKKSRSPQASATSHFSACASVTK